MVDTGAPAAIEALKAAQSDDLHKQAAEAMDLDVESLLALCEKLNAVLEPEAKKKAAKKKATEE